MFGYLVAEPGLLTEAEYARYRGCYCGLCRAIKDRWGQLARLSLTYDMSFLCLLFGSLYEPEETAGEGKCLPHPIEARAWWKSEFTDYAADMNVALAYLKCLDDWEDDGNPPLWRRAVCSNPPTSRSRRAGRGSAGRSAARSLSSRSWKKTASRTRTPQPPPLGS